MKKHLPTPSSQIAIVGAGYVGLLAALTLAPLYERILLIGTSASGEDGRTSALMMPAIRQLDQTGIWADIQKQAAALVCLRIIDATDRLVRASPVTFRAAEIGEAAFGYNIPNKILNKTLTKKVKATPAIIWHECLVRHYQPNTDHVSITLTDGSCHDVALVVAADGSKSPAREAAGIKVRQWHYPQTALVMNFSHQQPHQNTSNEFHTSQGPFTQVPLSDSMRSSLVWVVKPQVANYLLGLGRERLATEIERHMQSMLGRIRLEEENRDWPPQSWPLSGVVLNRFAARRIVLIGEAAHVFPPIGAQGLNLGMRDITALACSLHSADQAIGSTKMLDDYNHRRQSDIWLRTGLVHALNRTLLSDFFPAQLVRSLGLETLRHLPPLRAYFMHEGLAPGGGLRSLLPCLRRRNL